MRKKKKNDKGMKEENKKKIGTGGGKGEKGRGEKIVMWGSF